jgi:hypothetical protein
MGNIGEIRTHACHVALWKGLLHSRCRARAAVGANARIRNTNPARYARQRRQRMPCCRRHCRPTLRRNAAVTTTRAELDQAAKLSSHRIHLTAD